MRGKGLRCSAFILVALLMLGVSSIANAETLVGFTDNNLSTGMSVSVFNLDYPEGRQHAVMYSSWTQSVSATNVSVSAILNDFGFTSGTQGFAFLVNAIGPSATVANQIAYTYFTPSPMVGMSDLTGATYTPLFSGLNLSPGTYYLVLDALRSPTAYSWVGDYASQTSTLAAGFTAGPSGVCSTMQDAPFTCVPDSHAPKSNFFDLGAGYQPFYLVQGQPSAAVPEPSTLLLLLTAGAGLLSRKLLK